MQIPKLTILILWAFLLAGSGRADEPAAPAVAPAIAAGASRADVIAKFGKPKSAVQVGSREVLLFEAGKVTLVNGQLRTFEPAAVEPTEANPVEITAIKPDPVGGTYTEIRVAQGRWLTKLDEAKAAAAQDGKRILFLVTGDMSVCPAGVRFNRLVASGSSFARTMSSNYVLLLLDISALGNSPDNPIEIGSAAHKEFLRTMESVGLREQVFKSDTIPAMAILSPDTRTATVVDIEQATSIAGYDDMLNVTKRSIQEAEKVPLKPFGSSLSVLRWQHIAIGLVALVGLMTMIKRFL